MIVARLHLFPIMALLSRIVCTHDYRLANFYMICMYLGFWPVLMSPIQTVNTVLLTMYSVDIIYFVFNICDMIYSNNPSASLIPLAILASLCIQSHAPLITQRTQLIYKKGKIRYNLFHIQLIFVFFFITGLIISPYSNTANWVIHIYTFLVSVEISIVSQTREFWMIAPHDKTHPYHDGYVAVFVK